jgi:hypothetical protein
VAYNKGEIDTDGNPRTAPNPTGSATPSTTYKGQPGQTQSRQMPQGSYMYDKTTKSVVKSDAPGAQKVWTDNKGKRYYVDGSNRNVYID